MASQIDIVNRALFLVKMAPVSDLDEPNESARQAKSAWSLALDSVLRDHPWAFARRRLPLAILEENDGVYVYPYPIDCVMARKAYTLGTPVPFWIGRTRDGKQKAILSKCRGVELEYTCQVDNPEEFDPHFANALTYRLAAEMSIAVQADTNAFQALLSAYMLHLAGAKLLDAREMSPPPQAVMPYIAARGF